MHSRFFGGVAAAAVAVVCAGQAQAQSTSAALRGAVVDEAGAPVAGASVTIIHTPTGSASVSTTNEQGRFFESGLRVGGPFSVTVTAPGFEAAIVEGLSLRSGQPETANIVLAPTATDRITIVGTAIESALSINNGVGSVFSAEDLANQPSIQRDVISSILADPFVTSTTFDGRGRASGVISIAGQAPRFNGFVIDGLAQGNDFGLDQGIFPTLRQPISIDWIEETSVQASDYSVQSGGFTGGLVNVITKSGSNEFDGGAYYYFRDDSLVGDSAFGEDVNQDAFEETEFGAFLGGPIVKDKLFFFAGYEEFENTRPLNFDFGDTDPAIFDEIRSLTQSVYNYDPGSKSDTSVDELAERWLIKGDWNINDDHRLSASIQYSEDNLLTNTDTFSFPTSYYVLSSEQTFLKSELVSDWTDNFSTIFRISTKDYVRGQNSLGDDSTSLVSFGEFEIEIDPSDPFFAANGLDGDALVGSAPITIGLGPDQFRHANAFEDERTVFFGQGDYVWDSARFGSHVFSFGAEFEQYELDNIFGQRAKGFYEFGSLTDFANQDAFVTYINAQSNDVEDVRAVWGYDKFTAFAEDNWQITPKLNVNYGIRYERFFQDDEPPLAEPIVSGDGTTLLNYEEFFGLDSQANLDGLDIIQPRFGFSYDFDDRLRLSGGLGLFSGGSPQVWASNNFTPATFFAGSFVTDSTGFDVPTVLEDQVAEGVAIGGAVQNLDVFDENFEIPSVLRASLRADYELDLSRWGLGDGYQLAASLLYSEQREAITWKNLTQLRGDVPQGVAPDGRPIYADLGDLPDPSDPLNSSAEFSIGDVFLITTEDGGETLSLALQAAKQYENGLGFNVSYAWTDAEDLLEYTSSRAVSAWRGGIGTDRNFLTPATSSNEIEHKFTMSFNYERDFFKDLTSEFSLFGIVQSGQPYSFGYDVGGSNPIFGRALGGSPRDGADLLYIPNLNADGTGFDDPAVVFASPDVSDALLEAVNFFGFTPGSVVDRNSHNSPWSQRWDFRYQQELPGIPGVEKWVGDNRVKFVFDVENVGNLLNSDWGTTYNRSGRFGRADLVGVNVIRNSDGATLSNNEPAEFCQAQSDCTYEYTFVDDDFFEPNRDEDNSVYKIRLGLRYEF